MEEFTETFLSVAGLRVSLGANAASVRAFAVWNGAILVVGTQVSQQSGDHADRCRGRSVRGCHSWKIELSDESMSTDCRCFSRGERKKRKGKKEKKIFLDTNVVRYRSDYRCRADPELTAKRI